MNYTDPLTGYPATADMRPKAGTRSEHVRELIEEGIATGSFPPGMRLDEMELAVLASWIAITVLAVWISSHRFWPPTTTA